MFKKILSLLSIFVILCTALCGCSKGTIYYEGTSIPAFETVLKREPEDVSDFESLIEYTYHCEEGERERLIKDYKSLLISEQGFREVDQAPSLPGTDYVCVMETDKTALIIQAKDEETISIVIPAPGVEITD